MCGIGTGVLPHRTLRPLDDYPEYLHSRLDPFEAALLH
jgi:hypothetical protein